MKKSSKAVQKYIITGPVLYFPLLLRLGYGPTLYHIHPPKIAKQLNQTPDYNKYQKLQYPCTMWHRGNGIPEITCPNKRGNVVLK